MGQLLNELILLGYIDRKCRTTSQGLK